jgi:DNA-binding transcriptional ArsR family regulator
VIELLGLAPSTVSKHLSILHQARLVEARKEGRWMYYRLPEPEGRSAAVGRALEWVLESLRNESPIRADRRALRAICCVPPEALCQAKRNP